MTDWHAKGRYGTGDRPLSTGPEQSAYDAGAQQRRFEEERRLREQRDHFERQRQDQQKRQREDRDRGAQMARRSEQQDTRGDAPMRVTDPDDELDFDAILKLIATICLTFILVRLWGMSTASLAPTSPILSAIVDHGVWGVGLIGVGLGIRFQETLLPIAKILVVLAILFFGSALIVGTYRGLSG